jgi:hypothetical protein
MADSTASSDSGAASDGPSRPGAPLWVKIFAVIAVVAVIMVAVMLLAGGDHGPGRHSSGDAGGPARTSSATQSPVVGGHEPPAGGHTP